MDFMVILVYFFNFNVIFDCYLFKILFLDSIWRFVFEDDRHKFINHSHSYYIFKEEEISKMDTFFDDLADRIDVTSIMQVIFKKIRRRTFNFNLKKIK